MVKLTKVRLELRSQNRVNVNYGKTFGHHFSPSVAKLVSNVLRIFVLFHGTRNLKCNVSFQTSKDGIKSTKAKM